MAKIKSNTPLDIVIDGNTIFTADTAGVSITGNVNLTQPAPSASYAESASLVNTLRDSNTDADFFLTFVDSNNDPGDFEQLYTNGVIKANPNKGSIQANSFTGSLQGTASYALNGGGNVTFASRFIIHNGEGSSTALTTGIKYTTTVIADKESTITGWKIFCNPSSSITLDILKANKIKPTSANSITGSAAPTITNNQYAESTTLTGWTTSIIAGDILVLNIVSNTSASYIQLELTQQ